MTMLLYPLRLCRIFIGKAMNLVLASWYLLLGHICLRNGLRGRGLYYVGDFYFTLNMVVSSARLNRKSVAYWRLAAREGDADAMSNLAGSFALGDGCIKDLALAIRIYQRAADLDSTPAMENLGWCYQVGEGVPQDFRRSVILLKKAAKRGLGISIYHLGLAYYKGEGVRRDLRKAAACFREAARKGETYAQYEYAVCLSDGEGVRRNRWLAVLWLCRSYVTGGCVTSQEIIEKGALLRWLYGAIEMDDEGHVLDESSNEPQRDGKEEGT